MLGKSMKRPILVYYAAWEALIEAEHGFRVVQRSSPVDSVALGVEIDREYGRDMLFKIPVK